MSVLAMAMVKKALTICPAEAEEGRIIRDPHLLFNTISSLGFSKQQFYNMFIQTLEHYIIATVLPSLREKHDEFMLRELLERWTKHKDIDRWLKCVIDFLHQKNPENWQPPIPFEKVGFTFFRELIYPRCKGQVKDAALAMIHKERANEQIDWELLKDVLDILVELGSDQMDCYKNDFENFLLEATTEHYSVKAQQWILQDDSYPAYMVKVEECFKQERERVGHYLQISSEPKLLKRLQNVLLGQSPMQLLEKEKVKFFAFLRDDKVQDLSNMYRAFSESNHGAKIIAMFRTHLTNDIAHQTKQAEDSAKSNTEPKKDMVEVQVFVWKVIELHEKYVALVKESFQNHARFRKVLVDALVVACSKNAFAISSAELLATFCDNILKNSSEMISDDGLVKVENLSRMYSLFSEIKGGLDPLAKMFKTLLLNEGSSLVKLAEYSASNKEPKKDVVKVQDFVWKIIKLHEKYVGLVKECFQNHASFRKILLDAFEVFCSKNVFACSSAELLATFCDNILKKGTEKLSDEAVEDGIEMVVRMLAYISDKDIFAAFYSKRLARRLLFDKSANDEHERSFLKKFEQQFGGHFMSNMKCMVNDVIFSRDEQTKFEQFIAANPELNPGTDLSVIILRAGCCQSYKTFDMNLPPEMMKCIEVFKEFYQTRTNNRKLTWIYSLGTCNINATFESKSVEIIVTTCQAAILLLFNISNRLSFSEIVTRLNLPDDIAVCSLHYLSCSKYKILNKEPANRTISPCDVFVFNSHFTCRKQRIKIPLPPSDEKKEVLKHVYKDRRHAIEGSIVRIMKFRRVMAHDELVAECVKQLRPKMFEPDVKSIKKQIESLIDREYMERHRDNMNIYIYLA